MKPGPKPVKSLALDDLGTDRVVAMIVDGFSYREIAATFRVSPAMLVSWIGANCERSTAVARARELSAQSFEERAEQEIRSATTPFELAKARELAIHYRWRAKVVNPRQYGDKVDVQKTVSVRAISDEELEAKLAEFGIDVPRFLGEPPRIPDLTPLRLTAAASCETGSVRFRVIEE